MNAPNPQLDQTVTQIAYDVINNVGNSFQLSEKKRLFRNCPPLISHVSERYREQLKKALEL